MKIHFWELPEKRNYIKIKDKFRKKLSEIVKEKRYSWKIKNKIINGKISLEKIKKICQKEKISLKVIEKNILWIGGNNSRGLLNPKFPINFSTRSGARFVAAIINDGTLTVENKNSKGRLMYDNFDSSIRKSVINDYFKIFGGKKEEIAFRESEKKKYLEFSSIIRDIIELVIKDKGAKCESNLLMPSFILKNKETMIGWIEQTIADEGEIKFYPKKYRRAIVWRRSLDITPLINKKICNAISIRKLPINLQNALKKQKCNLIESEKKILGSFGISYLVFNLGIYPTVKGKIRTRFQIHIQKRENLLKIRKLIKIPSEEKNKKFSKMIKSYVRCEEIPALKEKIESLGLKNRTFTAENFMKKANYKKLSNTYKWLRLFEREKIIKKVKKASYGNGKYKQPAKYMLIQDK